MFRFALVLAVFLALVAGMAPVSAESHCLDAHENPCADACPCTCTCDAAPILGIHERTDEVLDPTIQRVSILDSRCLGFLVAADIFRPPATA